MTLMLSVDSARAAELLSEYRFEFSPNIPPHDYIDMFGNTCTRIVAPAGRIEISNDFLIADSGLPDTVDPKARQLEIGELPDDVLVDLLGSRYCDIQKLSNLAWSLFGSEAPGWQLSMTGFALAISTREATAPLQEVMRSGSAFAATSLTLLSLYAARYCNGISW